MTDSPPLVYTPLPPPADWWYKALDPKARVNIVALPRQRGKSTLALWFALSNAVNGKKVLYYAPIAMKAIFNRAYEHLRSGKQPHQTFVAAVGLDDSVPRITFSSDGEIMFSNEPHQVSGYNILVLDDVDLIGDLSRPLQSVFKMAQSILVTGTPSEGQNALNTLLSQAAGKTDWHVYEVAE